MEFGDKIGVWDKFDVNLLYKEQIGWKALRIYQGFGINLTDLKSRLWCTTTNKFLETVQKVGKIVDINFFENHLLRIIYCTP